MLNAAFKALSQMFTPPFRSVLLKSIGLAVVLLIVGVIGLQQVLAWLTGAGSASLEQTFGPGAHTPVTIFTWLFAIAAGVGLVVGAAFLMPTVTALMAGLFVDEIAEEVERTNYPDEPPGEAVPLGRALVEGVKIALLTLAVYLCALPFLLVAGLGIVIFFLATAYLLSRQYFELAAMRFHPPAEARVLRKAHQGTLFVAGMIIALFVSIPIVNLATPLFATAFMVHMHKRLTARRIELLAPARGVNPAAR